MDELWKLDLIKLLSKNDIADEVFYFEHSGRLLICINCNDFFYYACSDSEEIKEEDIPLLEEYIESVKQTDFGSDMIYKNYHALYLLACNKRKELPLPSILNKYNEAVQKLYNQAIL